jgi:hypothetical protein
MATVRLNPAFDSAHGRLGKIVLYNRNGIQCARSYAVPRNPDTPAQRENRKTFAEAVKLWQGLTPEEKYRYNRNARKLKMSGYNLFISGYLKEKTPRIKGPSGTIIRAFKIHGSNQLRSASTVPSVMEAYREYPYYIHALPPVSG